MIDYEKAKIAYEICQESGHSFSYFFGGKGILSHCVLYDLGSGSIIDDYETIDELLDYLKELTQSKPKYEGCLVGGCDGKHNAKGYCAKHYMRIKNHGDPDIVKPKGYTMYQYDSLDEYFDKKTKKEVNGCLTWIGACDPKGYGNVATTRWGKEYKISGAHRLAYFYYNGPIPNGLHVLHKCDNPSCVNLDHLFLGTHADNMRDMGIKGRSFQSQGEQGPRAKLTKMQALDIFNEKYSSTAYELSERYGVCVQTIRNIWCGKTKYLPDEFYDENEEMQPPFEGEIKGFNQCQHESDGHIYDSRKRFMTMIPINTPYTEIINRGGHYKCIKCGEFYR